MLQSMKRFINKAVFPMPIESGEFRVGLVDYNVEPSQKLSYPHSSKSAISLALDTIQSKPGLNDVPKAIDFVKREAFASSVIRAIARKVLVLFINGETRVPDVRIMGNKLKDLNDSDIDYVIVTVGSRPDSFMALKDIAEKHGKIILLEHADDTPMASPVVLKLIGIRRGNLVLTRPFSFKNVNPNL